MAVLPKTITVEVDASQHERLVCFFYLLIRDLDAFGDIKNLVRECPTSSRNVYSSPGGEALAREFVLELLTGEPPAPEALARALTGEDAHSSALVEPSSSATSDTGR